MKRLIIQQAYIYIYIRKIDRKKDRKDKYARSSFTKHTLWMRCCTGGCTAFRDVFLFFYHVESLCRIIGVIKYFYVELYL